MLLVMRRAADESLDNAGEKVQVMVGVVADAQRLNRSRVEFSEIFALVEGAHPGSFTGTAIGATCPEVVKT
jgi:hypothetical protein